MWALSRLRRCTGRHGKRNFVAVSRGVKEIMDYVTNREKTMDRLITGVNCMAQTAVQEFEVVKKQFRKTDGRSYYHIVQAFSPDDSLDFETAHQIGLELAQVKEFSNQLCHEHGLSIVEVKADPFAIPQWKKKLRKTIKRCMEMSYDKADFVRYMEMLGYKVKWKDSHKYITYQTPEGYACRDNKLFDQMLRRERMEEYFSMGGKEYLDNRIAWREVGEPAPTLDDAVCGLASMFEALAASDNDRFHLETVHHSEEEIQRMLARGLKVELTAEYAVDDEQDEEYEQFHGFSMTM